MALSKLAVINHFKGNVDWVKDLNFEYIIYNKFDPQIDSKYWKTDYENTQEYYKRLYSIPGYLEIMKPVSTNISNVGHDAFTFFTHIINYFDNLVDITIFLHSTPFHHYHGEDFIGMLNGIDEIIDFTDYGASMTSDINGEPTDKCPVGKIFSQLFPDQEVPETFTFTSGSLFSVSRSAIQRRGKSFFEQCRSICEIDPLAPWAFERLYRTIFTTKY
jgi:hypothetical protein